MIHILAHKNAVFALLVLVEATHASLSDLNELVQANAASFIEFPGNQQLDKRVEEAELVGHLQQLGKQRPPLGQIPEYFEAPSPQFLWNNHVKLYRPALLRGLLKASPAISSWTDDYLASEYGDLEVLVEKKYEDRKTEPKRMTIKAFLNEYEKRNWYVVSILPNAMKKDIKIPKPLMCGTLSKNLQELNIWIGTHGTRSMLHYDADNILHCLVAGRKDWILIHPRNKFRSDMAMNTPGQGSGFSLLDVDNINLHNSPDVADIPWEYASLYQGDCIYIPPQYMHQVRSFNRSISTTFLSYPHHQFVDDDCEGVDLERYRSLEEKFVFWGYEKGQETVDMGYKNPLEVRSSYLAVCEVLKLRSIDWEKFLYFLLIFGQEILENLDTPREIFGKLDVDHNHLISCEEFADADIEVWKMICRSYDNPHGPTRTAVSSGDPKLSNMAAEFNPRSSRHYIESNRTRDMLLHVLDHHGQSLPFHKFKKLIHTRRGSITEGFALLDTDTNGVLTKTEINDLPKEKLKKFYSMELNEKKLEEMTGYKLNDVEEEEDDPLYSETILTALNRTLREASEEAEARLSNEKLQSVLGNVVFNGERVELDTDFIFKILDRDGKGYISLQDIEAANVTDFPDEPKKEDDEPEGVAMAERQLFVSSIPYPLAVRGILNALVFVRSTVAPQELHPLNKERDEL